jgi:hypothetical protein
MPVVIAALQVSAKLPRILRYPWWKVTCLAGALYNEKVHLVDVTPADLPFPADAP